MNNKLLAAILAIVLVVVPVAMMSDSDATGDSSGNITVYFYDSEEGLTWDTVQAYDIYQAIMAANNVTAAATEGDDLWYYNAGGYYDINATYGTLATINGNSVDNYNIFVSTGDGWDDAQPALGWYRPYSDYASTVTFDGEESAGASNVAIIPTDVDIDDLTFINIQNLTQITTTSEYRYTFYIQDATQTVEISSVSVIIDNDGEDVSTNIGTTDLQNGVTIVGYGSDAYLALKNALGNNLAGQTTVTDDSQGFTTYYSWMDTMFGVGTVYEYDEEKGTSTYIYWSSYTSQWVYLSYTLGYYSSIDGADNDGADFRVIYERSTY